MACLLWAASGMSCNSNKPLYRCVTQQYVEQAGFSSASMPIVHVRHPHDHIISTLYCEHISGMAATAHVAGRHPDGKAVLWPPHHCFDAASVAVGFQAIYALTMSCADAWLQGKPDLCVSAACRCLLSSEMGGIMPQLGRCLWATMAMGKQVCEPEDE